MRKGITCGAFQSRYRIILPARAKRVRCCAVSVRRANCPALFVGAPASGQGKTTVTAALARHFRRCHLRVRVFKAGPDFLDPLLLEQASGTPVHSLDLWMGGEAHCRELLWQAACTADVILVEGAMGLFDGEPSGADLAARFGLPVLLVVDAAAMAQTFGALVFGLAQYRDDLHCVGVVANRVASAGHAALLRQGLRPEVPLLALLTREAQWAFPSRHLGLQQAQEIDDLEQRLNRLADALVTALPPGWRPPAVTFTPAAETVTAVDTPLCDTRIAVARDLAFSFVYRANLDVLERLGAELIFFSPLHAEKLPEADALYLPGGYPELHAATLAANQTLHASLREHHAQGKPIVAECGGMLLLVDALKTVDGERHVMAGLLPGVAVMQSRLANIGLHGVTLPEGPVRGHSFHYSVLKDTGEALLHSEGRRGKPEAVFRRGRLHASYLHLYFPSNPLACARLFAT